MVEMLLIVQEEQQPVIFQAAMGFHPAGNVFRILQNVLN